MFGWGWKGERGKGGGVTSCSAYLLHIPFRELSLDELANLIDQLSHVPQVAALVQGEPPPPARPRPRASACLQVADSDLLASRCVERLQAINSMRPSSRDIVLRGAKRHIST